jgi:hypothetical protein
LLWELELIDLFAVVQCLCVQNPFYLNLHCKIDHATGNDVPQNPNVLFLAPATEEEVLQIAKK